MEISEQTIIQLVQGQATTTQALVDLKGSFDKAIPYLVKKDEENFKAIRGVERKIWYFGGAGSVLGFIGTHIIERYFGGK